MSLKTREIEGTWEEVVAHANELAGSRVRLTVLSANNDTASSQQAVFRPRSGRSLLRHAGTWAGNDLQECLDAVVASRSMVSVEPNTETRAGNAFNSISESGR